MDGSHLDDTPIPNKHIISLEWWRTVLDVSLSVGDEIYINLFIPYDVKDQEVEFEMLDGQSFNNPQGENHHRTERLDGLGDMEFSIRMKWEGFHGTFGFSLPTGKIEDDPYELGNLGFQHRHIQFGTGTFDPILRMHYPAVLTDTLNLNLSAGLRSPLYENRKSYKGSTVIDFSIGPTWSVSDNLSLSARYTAQYQTRAYWDREPDKNSGYFLQGVNFSAPLRISKLVTVRPNALWIYTVNVRSGADNFEIDWLIGISIDVLFPN